MSSEAAVAGTSTKDSGKGTNVQVAVRCRPMNGEEKKSAQPCVIACDSEARAVRVNYGPLGKKIQKSFNFDKVFGMYSTQEEVFDQTVRPIVDETLAGFNCTIFAYGQTGTGKTHTMEGDIHSEEHAGIVPRSVKYILEQLEASGSEFTIRVSFLELYNEELQDLLAKPSDDKKLKLCEDVKKGVVCQNLEEITVLNVTDIFEILQRGIQQRITAETLCNKNSSRSHSIFTLKIMIKECNVEGEEVVRHGQLNLVDLAGSECVGRSGAKDNRAREAGSINQSLLTLGRVITALVDHHGHVPYRDSKLTRLLQESLGGKAKTCIIATLSPSQLAVEESMSTLDYAHRAKNIKNQPTVNQKSTKKVVLKEYCAEIESLKTQLQLTREKNGVYVDPAEFYAMEQRLATQENQITECEIALKTKTEEVKILKSERDSMYSELEETQQTLTSTEAKLSVITECFEDTKRVLQETEHELRATNAVVVEQVNTETTLTAQGQIVQKELLNRRDDVDGLLAKIDRYAMNESSRLDNTSEMINRLSKQRTEFNKSTNTFKTKCDSQSEFLSNGVSDMLSRSRTTCDDLRGAIDQALQTLIGDANVAKDSMTSSCDHLEKHLFGTKDTISATLLSIKDQLSSWLGDVDTAMRTAQQIVVTQQQQLNEMTTEIAQKCDDYVSQCSDLLKAQEAHSMNLLVENRELRSELVSVVEAFEAEHDQQMKATSDEVKAKAIEMELAMKTMLNDFVTSASSNLSASRNQSKQHCATVKSLVENGLSQAENKVITAQNMMKTNSNTLKSQVIQSAEGYKRQVAVIGATGAQAESTLKSISGTVIDKKRFLDNTVENLVEEVGSSINCAVAVVDQTSETANTILRDVTNATQRMNKSTTDSIDSLTVFLNTQGDVINKDLQSHFVALDHHLTGQQTASDTMIDEVITFGQEMAESKLRATGKTPKKVAPFKPLEKLVSTRDHTIIKQESKSGVAPVQTIDIKSISLEIEEEGVISPQEQLSDVVESTSAAESSPMRTMSSKSLDDSSSVSTTASMEYVENGDPNQAIAKSSMLPKKTSSKTAIASTNADGVTKRSTRLGSSRVVA